MDQPEHRKRTPLSPLDTMTESEADIKAEADLERRASPDVKTMQDW